MCVCVCARARARVCVYTHARLHRFSDRCTLCHFVSLLQYERALFSTFLYADLSFKSIAFVLCIGVLVCCCFTVIYLLEASLGNEYISTGALGDLGGGGGGGGAQRF